MLQNTHYISSEESEDEENVKVLVKRPKVWRSEWLDNRFFILDKKSKERNKGKGAAYIKRRIRQPSEKNAPEDAPEWALIAEFDEDVV